MKIVVTGANGQLGREIAGRYGDQHQLVLTDVDNLDITDYEAVREFLTAIKPAAVIHCAAYTNVDGAESDREGAFRVNAAGTRNLAAGCRDLAARMVYISTDYVFDGETDRPYRENDVPHPLNVYGTTKLQGENFVREIAPRHYILRTAWLYGEGKNFVRTMLKLARERDSLQVVNDQIGTPTYTKDLATAIFKLLAADAYGTYHASNNGAASWYDFAVKIFELAGVKTPVAPVPTAAFPRPARRPKYSVLENYRLAGTVGDPMRPWEEALADYLG